VKHHPVFVAVSMLFPEFSVPTCPKVVVKCYTAKKLCEQSYHIIQMMLNSGQLPTSGLFRNGLAA